MGHVHDRRQRGMGGPHGVTPSRSAADRHSSSAERRSRECVDEGASCRELPLLEARRREHGPGEGQSAQNIGGAGKALCAVSAPARRAVGNRIFSPPVLIVSRGDWGRWLPRRGSFAPLASGLILHHAEAPTR